MLDVTTGTIEAVLDDESETPVKEKPKTPPASVLEWTKNLGVGTVVLGWDKTWVLIETPYDKIVSLWEGCEDHDLAIHIRHVLQHSMGSRVVHYGHKYPLKVLAKYYKQFESYFNDREEIEGADGLMEIIQHAFMEHQDKVKDRLARGVVEFNDIDALFQAGDEVMATYGHQVAGRVSDVSLQVEWMATYWVITVDTVHIANGMPEQSKSQLYVGPFDDEKAIGDLSVIKITPEQKAKLLARGMKVNYIAANNNYVGYRGDMIQPSWFGDRHYRADGRLMIDGPGMRRMDSDAFEACVRSIGAESRRGDIAKAAKEQGGITITEENGWMVHPLVPAFSLAIKKWGLAKLDGVHEINWRTEAFDQLVLPADEKAMVRALVEHHGGSFEDIVEGKGGGCIFLLHGSPGQGKTLTAEAVAELLHRPLYSVSVGELGTEPQDLERSLRRILDVATTWNAVLLLDEADIFLEARDEKDILRNAMVGVFLRLLEYHQGVLFLTTNRVKNIDHAFYSRISVALKFGEADDEKRAAIWRNLLGAAKIDGIDVPRLAKMPLNGRQAKNSIRLAQTLARAGNETVTTALIEKVIMLSIRFEADLVDSRRGL